MLSFPNAIEAPQPLHVGAACVGAAVMDVVRGDYRGMEMGCGDDGGEFYRDEDDDGDGGDDGDDDDDDDIQEGLRSLAPPSLQDKDLHEKEDVNKAEGQYPREVTVPRMQWEEVPRARRCILSDTRDELIRLSRLQSCTSVLADLPRLKEQLVDPSLPLLPATAHPKHAMLWTSRYDSLTEPQLSLPDYVSASAPGVVSNNLPSTQRNDLSVLNDVQYRRAEREEFCHCGQLNFSGMMVCDNDWCSVGTWHRSCAGLAEGDVWGELWLCPACRKLPTHQLTIAEGDDLATEGAEICCEAVP